MLTSKRLLWLPTPLRFKVCDVADDLGIADKQDFTTYTNGKAAANTDEVTINANATTATIGEQGRLTEVYEDCVVMMTPSWLGSPTW